MKDSIEKKVNDWALHDPEIREVNFRVLHLEKRLFRHYVPCKIQDPDFFIRLKNWLNNLTDLDDQKVMFQLIPQLFYVSDEEIIALYRSAYNVEIARWLIDLLPIDLRIIGNETILAKAVERTWFCPITDSFAINDFIKINNIPSIYDLRPDWHSLTELGSPTSIQEYVSRNGIERVVMLEDFVGSGSQVESRVKFACQCLPNVDILCISLITCPKGVTFLNSMENTFSNLRVRHIVEIPNESLINFTKDENESPIFTAVRTVANSSYMTVTNNVGPGPKPYYPLGYKQTGGLVVLNTNVPDNTLPLVHHQSATWTPLFKRITRI
jgi:hypothetical protein